ncbi:MAG: Hsp20/alpha crystallin family protein [Candidatus Bathyarchaeota archaeon]|nr:Hsp20/alpha crystallin family protein [Candidatus Bathyarchaeota archaeon]
MAWTNDDHFDKIIEKLFKQFGFQPPNMRNLTQDTNSWVYGYSMTMGPDGKPVIREFGNRPNMQPMGQPLPELYPEEGPLEPLVQADIDMEERKVRVLVELPGVTKESIKVNATENLIRISAEHESRKYETEIPLMGRVDPNSSVATYNNGILDLTFDLLELPNDEGVDIQVN